MKKMKPMNDKIQLDLEVFQGPFDLLLHLIKQLKIDINDIPMAQITQQYLEYVHSIKHLEIDGIADYLVMASTLIEIKSRLLLPIEVEETHSHEDPRHDLVQHLLLYQQFQEVTLILEEKQHNRSQVFSKPSEDISQYQQFIPLPKEWIDSDDLFNAMTVALMRQLNRIPPLTTIDQDPVTIEDKISQINRWLVQNPQQKVTFKEILHNYTRSEVVATFMAMLELVRKQTIVLEQSSFNDSIIIYGKLEEER